MITCNAASFHATRRAGDAGLTGQMDVPSERTSGFSPGIVTTASFRRGTGANTTMPGRGLIKVPQALSQRGVVLQHGDLLSSDPGRHPGTIGQSCHLFNSAPGNFSCVRGIVPPAMARPISVKNVLPVSASPHPTRGNRMATVVPFPTADSTWQPAAVIGERGVTGSSTRCGPERSWDQTPSRCPAMCDLQGCCPAHRHLELHLAARP